MNLKNKTISFLGDSITEGCGASSVEKRFDEVLMEMAELADVNNYGIGGTRIARQQKINPDTVVWDENSYCERFDKVEEADIIVVFGGTNDYGHGDAPFGAFDDRTPDTYCGALHYLMSNLIKKFPKSDVVFITPLHREGENTPNKSNGLTLKAYVDMIKQTAEYYSLPVLDLYANGGICPDIPEQKELYTVDGLHPNDLGYERIAKKLKTFLELL